jgi:hypothetical protein
LRPTGFLDAISIKPQGSSRRNSFVLCT